MTRAEAKQQGFNIITNWQLFWLIISVVFLAGGSFTLSQYRISQAEKNIEKLERRVDKIDEITINLKIFMESQGLKYQEAK